MAILKEEGFKFLNSTSIKGLGRIVKARGSALRTLWIVGVLGLGTVCSYFTACLIIQYSSYPKSTNTYKSSNADEERVHILRKFIPTVTVCNEYPISSRYANGTEDTMLNAMPMPMLFYSLGLEKARQLGHQMDNLIAECQYGEKVNDPVLNLDNCQNKTQISFKYVPHPSYFNCYTIVVNQAADPPEKLALELIFYTDNLKRRQKLFDEGGIFLYFNKEVIPPFSPEVRVVPGQNLEIELSLTYTKRLPDPHGTCVDKPTYDSIWSLDGHKLRYSQMGCMLALLQNKAARKCGCISEDIPILGQKYENLSDVMVCGEDVFESDDASLDDLKPLCPELCEDFTCHKHVRSFPWIPLNEAMVFWDFIKNKDIEQNFNETIDIKNESDYYRQTKLHDFIKDNFARVKIELDLAEFVIYKEIPQLTPAAFIGLLGGNLNLYCGISCVIVIELADLLISTSCRCWKTRKASKNLAPKNSDLSLHVSQN